MKIDKLYLDFKKFSNNNIVSIVTKKLFTQSKENIFNSLNISEDKIAKCTQIHSNNVKYVSLAGNYENVDGLISNLANNIFLQIVTADCIPVFMFDDSNGNIGLLHSGWKGTCKSIIKNGIDIFIHRGSKVNNIKIMLGPSIKSCCYEIQKDVSALFNKEYVIISNNKQYLDMNAKIRDDLLMLGINKKNIFISNICTYEDEEFHSYRREGKDAGRIYSIIGL